MVINPLNAKKSKVKVTLCQRARLSPSGFAVPYHFSISSTCGFAFRHYELISTHLALKGLKSKNIRVYKNIL